MVSSVVPPAGILAGEKLLETAGLDGVTLSPSAAEHTPDTQPGDAFVLVTAAGGDMTAVLVTRVWADAGKMPVTKMKANARCAIKGRTKRKKFNKKEKKLKLFKQIN